MKSQFICVILVIFSLAVMTTSADFRQFMQDCMSEHKVTEAELRELMASDTDSDANDNIKCYSKCMMEKQGQFSNGVFNSHAVLDSLKSSSLSKDNTDEITSAVQTCKDIKGSNECDTSFRIFMCLKDHKATQIPH